ncbi:hypothetical protein PPACK8108_LOCUS16531, partial [Phakopsora pachyrhizi]
MWPSHSKKSSCALCGYLFSFEMVYKSPPFLLCVSPHLILLLFSSFHLSFFFFFFFFFFLICLFIVNDPDFDFYLFYFQSFNSSKPWLVPIGFMPV